MPILSLLIFIPLIGAAVILFLNTERHRKAICWTATVAAAVAFVLSLGVWVRFVPGQPGMQFTELADWIDALNIHYHLGIDGLSLPLILLTTLLSLLSVIYSWRITDRIKEYMIFFLLLETGILGVFCALDFFLFYIFWEVSLVPMFFLIGIWGGPRRAYAAIKFFIYTLIGSLAILLGILALYFASTPHTFDMIELARQHPFAGGGIAAALVFWGFFLGFAIKVPLFPFHTWLPDAHVEAPTAGSVILAGVLLKMGCYGFIRVNLPILPEASRHFALWIAVLALISIIYGALCAMAQKDLKRMIAYSSVNHMGYVMLGIAAAVAFVAPEAVGQAVQHSRIVALNGAVLQMVAHGIITGALFFLVGVIYERTHLRDIDAFGGLAKQMPVYAGIMMLACFASLGLPGLAGFAAEFLVFLGSYGIYKLITGLALLGIAITAAYFLMMIQGVFLGELRERWQNLRDLDAGELVATIPLAVLMLAIGLYPDLILAVVDPASTALVTNLEQFYRLSDVIASLGG